MMSEAFSAIIMVGPFRLPLVICIREYERQRREGEERGRGEKRVC